MISVVSDDEALRDNLRELLILEGVEDIVICKSYLELRNIEKRKLDLIIYNNSEDPGAQAFRWYMLANDPQTSIPVIFLNIEEPVESPENELDSYRYLQLPFETDRLVATSASLIKKRG